MAVMTAPTETPSPAKPCECPGPDGHCDACEDEHGHTCIVCGYDFCGLCWETSAHNDDCKRETPSLTTEQARATATGWAMLRDYERRLAAFRAGEGGGFPLMAARPPGPQAIEQLFAWVRAYADAASAEGLDVSDVAGNLSIELNLDSGDEYDEQQAGELLKAARWPS